MSHRHINPLPSSAQDIDAPATAAVDMDIDIGDVEQPVTPTEPVFVEGRSHRGSRCGRGARLSYSWKIRILAPARRLQLHHTNSICKYKIGV
jgi:hypothetical protein